MADTQLKSLFFSLPRELRNNIYGSLYYEQADVFQSGILQKPYVHISLTNYINKRLLLVCREFKAEYEEEVFENAQMKFVISLAAPVNACPFDRDVKTLGYLSKIRRVEVLFHNVHGILYQEMIPVLRAKLDHILRETQNLKRLTIVVHDSLRLLQSPDFNRNFDTRAFFALSGDVAKANCSGSKFRIDADVDLRLDYDLYSVHPAVRDAEPKVYHVLVRSANNAITFSARLTDGPYGFRGLDLSRVVEAAKFDYARAREIARTVNRGERRAR